MQIYLAGHVPKGLEETNAFNDWRVQYGEIIRRYFDAELIDPMVRTLDESDFLSIVGLDCFRIKSSDFMIVNAEEYVGPGTAQELMIAKYFLKPVVTVLPKECKHRKKDLMMNGQIVRDWMHPFLFTFSDFIIEDIDGIEKIKNLILMKKPKGISMIDESIAYLNSLKNV